MRRADCASAAAHRDLPGNHGDGWRWPDQQLGDIRSVKPDGTDLQVHGGGINPYDLDLAGNTLYWTDQNGNAIFTLDTSNPAASSVPLLTNLSHPVAIDVAGGHLYWSEVAGVNRIRRAGLDGSGPVTLVSNIESRDLEVTENFLYLTTTAGQVVRTALDGSGSVVLKSDLGFLNGIDVTDEAIYVSVLNGTFEGPGFTTTGGGEIYRMHLDGSNSALLYTATEGFVGADFRADPIRGVAVLVAVPEPQTWMLMLGGALLVGAAVRRKR